MLDFHPTLYYPATLLLLLLWLQPSCMSSFPFFSFHKI
jgi:hypothetical protein